MIVMILNEQDKKWIDGLSYKEMLHEWRFAPIGSPMFQGDSGRYFSDVMNKKKSNISDEEHTKASKAVGWE